MTDRELDILHFIETASKEQILKTIVDLEDWKQWYSMWHNKFKKEIEELKTELETYRPTKLNGEGQTTCHKCKQINWTCFGFYHYKGQTLCDECLKEILAKESIK